MRRATKHKYAAMAVLIALGLALTASAWPDRLRVASHLLVHQERVAPCPGEPPALTLAYGQELARLGQKSLPRLDEKTSAHLRRGPERGRVRLELEAPPDVEPGKLAAQWAQNLRDSIERERATTLAAARPVERDCLAQRLFSVVPLDTGSGSFPEPVGVPWLAVSLVLLVVCVLGFGQGRHDD